MNALTTSNDGRVREAKSAAQAVVQGDLDEIVSHASAEFQTLSGNSVLIAGGAGFLGYYLVQAALHWNTSAPAAPPIRVTVLDNFIRGVPEWLTALEGDPNLRLLKHDITKAAARHDSAITST